jgi:hypothetical protein
MQIINPLQYYFFNLILPLMVVVIIVIIVVFAYKMGTTGRSTGKAIVLVICPYCGAKTEQGREKCQKCGANL